MDLKDTDSVIDKIQHGFKPDKGQEDELIKLQQQQQALLQTQNVKFLEKSFQENATRPVNLSNVQIEGTESFREPFLVKLIQPFISNSQSVEKLLSNIDIVSRNFQNTESIKNIEIQLDTPTFNPYANSSTSLNAIQVIPKIKLTPISKFTAKTGTNIGNGEGDGYMTFQWRNIFGGGESLMLDATTGTRTRSSYLLNYSMPFVWNNFVNPEFSKTQTVWKFNNSAFITSRKIDWSSHEQLIKGITNKLNSLNEEGWNHEIGMETLFRTITNVVEQKGSSNVLFQAGDNFKNSFTYKLYLDSRDDKILASKGTFLQLNNEISGLLSLNSSRFLKSSFEGLLATSSESKRFILNASIKTGLLYTFDNSVSHLMDRFYVGGPNDVRSFFYNGIGPRNFNDTLGGDLFLNGGLSLFTKIGKFDSLLFHNFINFGRLIPWDHHDDNSKTFSKLVKEPSIGVGCGLVFKHPVARFELNFVVPLTAHESDSVRKGFQYGIGLTFL